MPEIAYQATDNEEINISTIIAGGKGDNLFSNLKRYDMIMLKLKYNF